MPLHVPLTSFLHHTHSLPTLHLFLVQSNLVTTATPSSSPIATSVALLKPSTTTQISQPWRFSIWSVTCSDLSFSFRDSRLIQNHCYRTNYLQPPSGSPQQANSSISPTARLQPHYHAARFGLHALGYNISRTINRTHSSKLRKHTQATH